MRTYKVIGPHLVKIPPNVEFKHMGNGQKEPVLTPIDEALNAAEKDDWTLVSIIDGFPISIPSTISVPGKPQVLTLTGVCALLRKRRVRAFS